MPNNHPLSQVPTQLARLVTYFLLSRDPVSVLRVKIVEWKDNKRSLFGDFGTFSLFLYLFKSRGSDIECIVGVGYWPLATGHHIAQGYQTNARVREVLNVDGICIWWKKTNNEHRGTTQSGPAIYFLIFLIFFINAIVHEKHGLIYNEYTLIIPISECYILQLDANAHKSYPQATNLTVRLTSTPLVFPSHNNLNRPIQSYLGLLIRTLILMPLSMSHFQFPSKIKNHLTIKSCEVN